MSIVQPGCDAVKRKLDDFFNSTKTDRRNIYKKCIKQDTGSYPNIPCLDQIGILKWFNNPQVRKAIHTNVSDSQQWTICNDIIPQAYIKDSRQAYWLYPTLIRANLRIVLFKVIPDDLLGSFRRHDPSHRHHEVDRGVEGGAGLGDHKTMDELVAEGHQWRRCLGAEGHYCRHCPECRVPIILNIGIWCLLTSPSWAITCSIRSSRTASYDECAHIII